jgi:hypothetical protein
MTISNAIDGANVQQLADISLEACCYQKLL